jgi:hypothetical protein
MMPQMQQRPQMPQNMQMEDEIGEDESVPHEESSGVQMVQNTEFNQDMQNIIYSRLEEEGQKNPSFGEALSACLTDQAAAELALLIPELMPILRADGFFGQEEAPMVSMNQAGGSPNPFLDETNKNVSRGLMVGVR